MRPFLIIFLVMGMIFFSCEVKGGTMRLRIDEPGGVVQEGAPVRTGIPFPKGVLSSARNVRILGPEEEEIEAQVKEVVKWPDGSVKWIWVDFFADLLKPKRDVFYTLEYGPEVKRRKVAEPITISQDESSVIVDTGPLKFEVKKGASFIGNLFLNGKLIARGCERGSFSDVLDEAPDPSKGEIESIHIEEAGPLHAVIKCEGTYYYERNEPAPFTIRISAYKGKTFIRILHTFVYTGEPNKADWVTPEDMISAIGLRIRPALEGEIKFAAGCERKVVEGEVGDAIVYLLQAVGHGKPFEIPPNKHISYFLYKGADFLEKGTAGEELLNSGIKSKGWMDFSDAKRGITAAVRFMVEEHPKEINYNPADGMLTVYEWPQRVGPLSFARWSDKPGPQSTVSNLAKGIGKTSEIFFYFHEGDWKKAESPAVARMLTRPSIAYAGADVYAKSRVYGDWLPYDAKAFPALEKNMELEILWWLFSQNDIRHNPWYGMLDFGDLQNDFTAHPYRLIDGSYSANFDWNYRSGRYGWNCGEAFVPHTLWLHWLRSGRREYYDMAEAFSRHIMDVDTTHMEFEHSFTGPAHKGWMRRHNVQHWSDGAHSAHNFTLGETDYYLLAGYTRGLDVAQETADASCLYTLGHIGHGHDTLTVWNTIYVWDITREKRYLERINRAVDFHFAEQEKIGADILGSYFTAFYIGPAFITTYELTGNEKARRAALEYARLLLENPRERRSEYYEAAQLFLFAYAYRETGDERYLEAGKKIMDYFRVKSFPEEPEAGWTRETLYNAIQDSGAYVHMTVTGLRGTVAPLFHLPYFMYAETYGPKK